MPPDEIPILEQAAYCSSRELKELGEEAIKIRGSRSTGILLTDGDIFVIYNTGPGQMKKWKYSSEVRLRVMLMMELEKRASRRGQGELLRRRSYLPPI